MPLEAPYLRVPLEPKVLARSLPQGNAKYVPWEVSWPYQLPWLSAFVCVLSLISTEISQRINESQIWIFLRRGNPPPPDTTEYKFDDKLIEAARYGIRHHGHTVILPTRSSEFPSKGDEE
jgi:hypothetical protein